MFCTNIVYAGVLLSDSGVVTYPAGKGYRSRSIVKKYNFSLKEDAKVTLRFITHVDRYVGIKLMETDTENTIKALTSRISIADNPFTRSVDLRAGQYTFIVYRERSGGNVDNTGTYKFTFTKGNRVVQSEVSPQQPIAITGENPKRQPDVKVKQDGLNNEKKEDSALSKGVMFALSAASFLMAFYSNENKLQWTLVFILLVVIGMFF